MTNKEKFLNLVSNEKTNTLSQIKERNANRDALNISKKISLQVLIKLDELNWTQKRLAEEMDVSPQQITKIVSGTQNFTLETLLKLEKVLQINIFATTIVEFIKLAIKLYDSQAYELTKTGVVSENLSSSVPLKHSYEFCGAEDEYSISSTTA
jgi:transcriptional regulator with XRE-family HTH domain